MTKPPFCALPNAKINTIFNKLNTILDKILLKIVILTFVNICRIEEKGVILQLGIAPPGHSGGMHFPSPGTPGVNKIRALRALRAIAKCPGGAGAMGSGGERAMSSGVEGAMDAGI